MEKTKLSDYFYELPEELIAQDPLSKRDESRLLVLNRKTGEVQHKFFKNIIEFLKPNDCLVINNTRVIPARLLGKKEKTEGKIEIFLLNNLGNDIWETLAKPGKKAIPGSRFVFGDKEQLIAEVVEVKEDGNRIVKFFYEGVFQSVLDEVGTVPLPPYIHKKLEDGERYQTVYSKIKGSSAAPTAGLHFTKELLGEIKEKGISVAELTLHVGLGTFRPVKEENILDHKMHSEWYKIDQDACDKINNARKNGGRVIAVGTTSCRVLESVAEKGKDICPKEGNTDIFIYPGYEFKILDGLITNFHLPESTLIMLVSAFAGYENTMNAYKIAVNEKYRFFSFGDAMFIS
jgi:S-adenosylmethionine:tRNA ribosyltransferase-isomerase